MNSPSAGFIAAINWFSFAGGVSFITAGAYLSYRRRALHPLLLLSISALSFSWIEAPYDWAMYAQFPPGMPRVPPWWPLNLTWGGLPSCAPLGYITYFVLPAVVGTAIGRRLTAKYRWRQPITLLGVGLVTGFCWALAFNAGIGARLGTFYYGYVIADLAISEGTRHQYPIYDALAMSVQMMVFTYLLGRSDSEGRNVIEAWAHKRSSTRLGSSMLSLAAIVVVGHVVYGAVFAPHLATKLAGWVTVGPSEQLYPGVPNQPR